MTRKIVTIDCETDPFLYEREPAPFVWGLYDGECFDYWWEENPLDFFQYLKDNNFTVYAHNGGKFDFHFMLKYLEPFIDIQVINGRLAKIPFGNSDLRDSFCIFPEPLAAYKKDDFDYRKMEKNVRDQHRDDIIKYLEKDCVYLYEIVTGFIESFGKKLTVASAALGQWQKIEKRKKPNVQKRFDSDIRPFYFGGRTQAFYKGIISNKFSSIDINSAYPFAMQQQHPISDYFTVRDNPKEIVGNHFYIIEGIAKGSLPFRDDKKALQFPSDGINRLYYITGWELLKAIETKTLKDLNILHEIAFAEFKDSIKYVDKFWNDKKQAEKGTREYLFSKRMLNSAYGKFGANPEKYNKYVTIPAELISEFERDYDYDFDGMLNDDLALMKRPLYEEEKSPMYINIAFAASITGFIRAHLFGAIHECQKRGTVYYCDTDSIATDKIPSNIDLGPDLGQWEIDGKYQNGGIAGKKLYAFKGLDGKYKTASKGTKLKPKQIISLAKNPQTVIEYRNDAPCFNIRYGTRYIKREVRQT